MRDPNERIVIEPTRRPWLRRLAPVAFAVVAGLAANTFAAPVADGLPGLEGPLTDAQRQGVLAEIDAVGRRGFLYEVARPHAEDASGASKLYLYGTVHLGRVGSEPFNAPVLQALRQSERLALEADPTDSADTRALAIQLGQYGDGDGLQRHVSPALMARVRAFGEKKGMPADRVGRFKPWLLANMVALTEISGIGLDPSLGGEWYLSGFARVRSMEIDEIEGLEAQLRLLAGLPQEVQAAQLDEALSDFDGNEARKQVRALFDFWLDGDAPAVDALVAEMHRNAKDKVFERYFVETLIDGRNRTMADKAESYLRQPGDTFFAIGSLHLFGDGGLIREFERRGYRVTDLQPALAATR